MTALMGQKRWGQAHKPCALVFLARASCADSRSRAIVADWLAAINYEFRRWRSGAEPGRGTPSQARTLLAIAAAPPNEHKLLKYLFFQHLTLASN